MPTLYWGPWLAKIRRGGPAVYRCPYQVFKATSAPAMHLWALV